MVITVLRHATLAPAGEERVTLALPEGARVRDALGLIGVAEDAPVVALLDGGPAWPDTLLIQGATLELLPLADGG